MNLIKLIDKQSNKLVSKSSGVGIDPFTGTPLYGANDSPNYTTTSINPFFSQFGIKTQQGINNYISGLSLKEFSQLPENLRLQYNNVWRQSQANQAGQMFADAEQKGIISPTIPNKSNDDKWLELATQAQNNYRGMQITNGVFDGISSLTKMGIWNAVEQSQNNAKLRDVYDKQMALAQEQIDASKELRKQRQEEIDRLKRVRSNTNQRFNSSAIVSRSY